jgi:hypothetical protein
MSDTNRSKLACVAESSFGAQKTGSNLQLLRVTGDSLARQASAIRSGEIRANRRVANVRMAGKQVGGSIGFELSYGTFDALFQAVLLSAAWTSPVTVSATTLSAAASDNSYNDSGAGLGTLSANQWVYVTGFTTPANNGFRKIVSKTTTKIVVSGGTLVDEVAGDSVSIKQGGRILDGTTLATFNFERIYEDLTNEIALFTGIALQGLTLNVPQQGIITGAFDCVGKDEDSITASGGSGYDTITTTEPMQASEVVALLENQSSMGVLGFTLAYNNNLRIQREIPTGVTGIGTGQIDISGTLQAYFTSKTLYDKWLDETVTALALALRDAAGNGYVLDLPQAKFTSGNRSVSGPSGDVTADLGWTAYEDSAQSATMTLTRFPAA